MKIVITDGYTLNPGDLSWKSIEKFGHVEVFERSSEDETFDKCQSADIVVTNKTPISQRTIENARSLKLIAVTATGYNIVDLDAAREKTIIVCNVPDYGTASVAQHTFALLLELSNCVGINNGSVHAGMWVKSPDFSYTLGNLVELEGKTLGIVGLGKIGERVATIASAFGMRVLFNSRSKKDSAVATATSLEDLFAQSDVVSLHCPLTKENKGFINSRLIGLMKKSAWLINTSRGQLIQEEDLADALNSGKISGAALDVLSQEPPVATNPLLGSRNCIITPHTAWMSLEARTRIMETTALNISRFLEGRPLNVI